MHFFFVSTLEQGLAYGVLAISVLVTFRLLDFPDLTIDATLTLGGAVAAVLIVNATPPVVATILAAVAGALAGMLTGVAHAKLGISKLLSGILVLTFLYSANLRIMSGANVSLLRQRSLFDMASSVDRFGAGSRTVILLAALAGAACFIHWFLRTELGGTLRAVGDNEKMVRALGVRTDNIKVIGVSLSNAIVAIAGALLAQLQGFADIGMGVGTLVVALASIIIGEALVPPTSLARLIVGAAIGAIVYFAIIGVALRVGVSPSDTKMATAVLVVLALATGFVRRTGAPLVIQRKY